MLSLDIQLFRLMYAWGASHPALAVFLGRDLIWVMVGLAAVFVIARARRGRGEKRGPLKEEAKLVLGSVSAAYLVKLLIGLIRFRNRPFVSLPEVTPFIGNPITAHAFPSGHATIAFAMATAVFCIDKRWGAPLLILAALVSVGRVLVGVHFPVDVVSGAVIGAITAYILFKWLGRLSSNVKIKMSNQIQNPKFKL